jgi:hypothetical protein
VPSSLQVIEMQRSQWADVARQYKDLFCRSRSDADGRHDAALLLLHRWIVYRVQWFVGLLQR